MYMQLRIIIILLASVLGSTTINGAPNEIDDRRMMAALRVIGHQVLLYAGDSTSRVMPIEKDANRYKISMESEFRFDPGQLVWTIDSTILGEQIANQYLVEVEECGSCEVVYSYEVRGRRNSDLVTCSSRRQLDACYNIFVTILDGHLAIAVQDGHTSESPTSTYLRPALMIIPMLFLMGYAVPFWKKRHNLETDADLLRIGQYTFDKRNMLLTLGDDHVELTSKEADLLYTLYTSANTTLEREEILRKVWGDKGDYVGRTLDVFISKLRKKLEADPTVRIANIRGIGYKLVLNNV